MRYTSAVGDVEVGDGRGSDGQVVRVRRTSWGLFFAITASSLTMHAATGQTASAQADVDVQVVPNIEGGSSQDDEARSLFLAGQTAFEAGRYEAALGHFRAALELSQRPQLLYNIGLAADRLRHDQEALTAFESFLQQVPESPLRAQVEARAEILRRAIEQQISPEEVAAAEERAAREGASQALAQREHDRPGVARRWWFWTLNGVAVAGVATAVIVASSGDKRQAPLPGDQGVVICALRAE